MTPRRNAWAAPAARAWRSAEISRGLPPKSLAGARSCPRNADFLEGPPPSANTGPLSRPAMLKDYCIPKNDTASEEEFVGEFWDERWTEAVDDIPARRQKVLRHPYYPRLKE